MTPQQRKTTAPPAKATKKSPAKKAPAAAKKAPAKAAAKKTAAKATAALPSSLSPAKRARAQRAIEEMVVAIEEANEEAAEAQEAAEIAAAATEAAAEAAGVELPELLPDVTGKFGRPGQPINRKTPFIIGFEAAFGVAIAYAILTAIVSVTQVLILIIVALFLAIGMEPAVKWLEKRNIRRGFSVAIVLFSLLGGTAGFIAAAIPPLTKQGQELVKELPNDLERLRDNKTLRDLDNRYHVIENLKKRADEGPTLGLKAVGGVFGFGKALLGAVFSVITVITLMIYFITNFNGVRDTMLRLVPLSRRTRVALITDEVLARVGGYVLGNLATSVVAGVTSLIVLEILGVPYAFALALLVAITDLIPLVGATIGAVICTAVAFFHGTTEGLIALVFFVAYQQFENFVVVPNVMRKTVDVSPLVTIVAALIGGSLLGILGALLAIPIAAALQLILGEVVFPRQEKA